VFDQLVDNLIAHRHVPVVELVGFWTAGLATCTAHDDQRGYGVCTLLRLCKPVRRPRSWTSPANFAAISRMPSASRHMRFSASTAWPRSHRRFLRCSADAHQRATAGDPYRAHARWLAAGTHSRRHLCAITACERHGRMGRNAGAVSVLLIHHPTLRGCGEREALR
jgi:hypothetical protein